MTPFYLILSVIIASYLRDILDGIILGIYEAITGKHYKEVIIKWSKKNERHSIRRQKDRPKE